MSQSKRTWRRRIGRVTVYLRGSRYWIYYRQGKQVRRPVGTSKEEALALAAKINAQLAEGAPTILAFQPIAVDALVAKWLDHHEHIRRSSLATVRRYRTAVGHLATFVQRDFGKLRADRFDSSKAEDFVRHLRKSGPVFLRRRFTGRGATPLLHGLSIPELEAETDRRTNSAQADQDDALERLDLLRIGKSVWRDAGVIKETVVRVEFMKVTKQIGLGHLTCPKDLRHLFATNLQAAGVDPMVRRDVMGHTTLDMTAHYTHTQNGTRDRELRCLSTVRGGVLELAQR